MTEAQAVANIAVADGFSTDGDHILDYARGEKSEIQNGCHNKKAEEKLRDFPEGDPLCGKNQKKGGHDTPAAGINAAHA